jgi:DNA adenine methylase
MDAPSPATDLQDTPAGAFHAASCSLPVTRPLLRYFGGKWQLRHWIIGHMPDHQFYAEPFAGAASVLLAKPPAPGGEIINDLNGDTINLFRVMQDKAQCAELLRRLDWTPYAKAELELSRLPSCEPVERARRMVIRSFMGIEVAGVRGTASGFRMGNVDLRRLDQDGSRTFRNTGRDWCNWKAALPAIRDRLADVMIYERDAMEFIELMSAPDALLYIDPPYHIDTRTRAHGGSRYAVEFSPAQHDHLVTVLLNCPAMVMLSGYPHDSYTPLEKAGWRRVDRDYRANMSARRRTEVLWMNFDPPAPDTELFTVPMTEKEMNRPSAGTRSVASRAWFSFRISNHRKIIE